MDVLDFVYFHSCTGFQTVDDDTVQELIAAVGIGAVFIEVNTRGELSDAYIEDKGIDLWAVNQFMSLAYSFQEHLKENLNLYEAAAALIKCGKWASFNESEGDCHGA